MNNEPISAGADIRAANTSLVNSILGVGIVATLIYWYTHLSLTHMELLLVGVLASAGIIFALGRLAARAADAKARTAGAQQVLQQLIDAETTRTPEMTADLAASADEFLQSLDELTAWLDGTGGILHPDGRVTNVDTGHLLGRVEASPAGGIDFETPAPIVKRHGRSPKPHKHVCTHEWAERTYGRVFPVRIDGHCAECGAEHICTARCKPGVLCSLDETADYQG